MSPRYCTCTCRARVSVQVDHVVLLLAEGVTRQAEYGCMSALRVARIRAGMGGSALPV